MSDLDDLAEELERRRQPQSLEELGRTLSNRPTRPPPQADGRKVQPEKSHIPRWIIGIAAGVAGAALGTALAEYTGIGGGLAAIAEPWSPLRNEIAKGYAAVGSLAGALLSMYRRPKTDRSTRRAILIVVAIGLVGATVAITVAVMHHQDSQSPFAAMRANLQAIDDCPISIERDRRVEGHILLFDGYKITNIRPAQITINSVTINGEYSAPLGTVQLVPDPTNSLPGTLTIGESLTVFINSNVLINQAACYTKEVIFVDVDTSAGKFHASAIGLIEPTAAN